LTKTHYTLNFLKGARNKYPNCVDFLLAFEAKNKRIVKPHNYFYNKEGGQKDYYALWYKQVDCLFVRCPLITGLLLELVYTSIK